MSCTFWSIRNAHAGCSGHWFANLNAGDLAKLCYVLFSQTINVLKSAKRA